MTDEHAAQIVRAIHAHTRAMVAATLWASTEFQSCMKAEDIMGPADALLAALSASTPLPRASMEETVRRSTERIEADLLRDRRAELSASSGGERDEANAEQGVTRIGAPGATEPNRMAVPDSVEGQREPATSEPSDPAIPPLSADLVTVRRADLVLYLDHSNRVEMASSEWDADLFSALRHLRAAVSR